MDDESSVLPMTTVKRVYIVDDDPLVRQTMVNGLGLMGYECTPYQSGEDFLDSLSFLKPGCLLLDLRMPGMTGLEVLEAIRQSLPDFPVVMFTSHGDVGKAVSAMQMGASDFIEKPCSLKTIAQKLDDVIRAADLQRVHRHHIVEARQLVDRLTGREAAVAGLLADGMSNKEIARSLDLSPRTVEMHRSNIMKRLEISSLAELVRLLVLAEGNDG